MGDRAGSACRRPARRRGPGARAAPRARASRTNSRSARARGPWPAHRRGAQLAQPRVAQAGSAAGPASSGSGRRRAPSARAAARSRAASSLTARATSAAVAVVVVHRPVGARRARPARRAARRRPTTIRSSSATVASPSSPSTQHAGVADHLGDRAGVARDHRHAEVKRLEQRDAEALVLGQAQERMRRAGSSSAARAAEIPAANVTAPGASSSRQRRSCSAKPRRQRRADQHQPRVRAAAGKAGERADHQVLALVRGQPADEQDRRRRGRRGGGARGSGAPSGRTAPGSPRRRGRTAAAARRALKSDTPASAPASRRQLGELVAAQLAAHRLGRVGWPRSTRAGVTLCETSRLRGAPAEQPLQARARSPSSGPAATSSAPGAQLVQRGGSRRRAIPGAMHRRVVRPVPAPAPNSAR